MADVIDVVKITSKGQITLPASVRSVLSVGEGDRVIFIRANDGSILLRNSNLEALLEARDAFEGAAEEAGLSTMEDVTQLVKSVRSTRRDDASCG
ncbi:AbrB/MazE/SpoVT family DNA-binding domain-containing protein [Olsenella uli]|uniref:AbrB/MazE/SpoVT family DNA-binding domain-containing protein n=1 Tax=Olsenella uli TaxID=133926 RepID=UPI00195D3B32|nr:AbrB/MazE/SpoVT family DNA-binding domain-containing protein [Olsenella uli]